MHSSAFGAAALIALRSFWSAARLSLLSVARYSSIVFGLAAMLIASPFAWKRPDGAVALLCSIAHHGEERVDAPRAELHELPRRPMKRTVDEHHVLARHEALRVHTEGVDLVPPLLRIFWRRPVVREDGDA